MNTSASPLRKVKESVGASGCIPPEPDSPVPTLNVQSLPSENKLERHGLAAR